MAHLSEKVCTPMRAPYGIPSNARDFPMRFFLAYNFLLNGDRDISDDYNSKKVCLIFLNFGAKLVS